MFHIRNICVGVDHRWSWGSASGCKVGRAWFESRVGQSKKKKFSLLTPCWIPFKITGGLPFILSMSGERSAYQQYPIPEIGDRGWDRCSLISGQPTWWRSQQHLGSATKGITRPLRTCGGKLGRGGGGGLLVIPPPSVWLAQEVLGGPRGDRSLRSQKLIRPEGGEYKEACRELARKHCTWNINI